MKDVIIVGAGPSGSVAAYLLAKEGYRTLIVDMKTFPRYKPCGGGVTWRAYNLLRNAGISLQSFEVYHKEVVIRGFGDEVRVNSDEEFAVATVRREKFDAELLEIALSEGAELRVARVTGIIDKGDSLVLRGIEERANYVIGADGAYSIIANSSGVRSCWRNEDLIFAIEGRAPRWEELTFIVDASPCGYGWIFPRESDSNAGVGGIASKSREVMGAFRKFSKDHAVEMIGAWVIPTGGHNQSIARGKVILIGDAAGLADPLTGEGLYYAFKSAYESVKSLESEDPASSYTKRMRDVLEELRLKRKARDIIIPRMGFFFKLFASYPEIARRYMLTSIGRLDFKEFWSWSLLRIPKALLKRYLKRKEALQIHSSLQEA